MAHSVGSVSRSKRVLADLALLCVAVVWGSAFSAQRVAAAHLGSFLYNGLRFLLAADHRVERPGGWKQKLLDRGVEARQLLRSMEWRGALERHCGRIGVRYDPKRVDRTVEQVVAHYAR